MSLKYDPDASLVDATWIAVFLSERDVAGQIPLNFITTSAVSLRAACFGKNVYDRNSAGKCISNLLELGYRRFVVDLYWSVEGRSWNFCPVTIPNEAPVVTLSSTTTSSATATPTSSSTTTVDAAQGTATVISDSSGSRIYELGPYQCSDNLYLSDMIDVFLDFFKATTSQLNVYTRFISFNLHAASSAEAPSRPAAKVSGTDLPTISERIDNIIDDRLYHYIYTPSQLADERSNLNESWYKVDDGYKPITEYFTIHEDEDGIQSTPDGWPCTKYIQLAEEERLLLEYGSIDPQMEDYTLANDNDIIFPPEYLTATTPLSIRDDEIETGCFYNTEAFKVSEVNSSWAVSNSLPMPVGSNRTQFLGELAGMVTNVTACGLTPLINSTILNSTADNDYDPYRNATLSAAWAWAIGEPRDSEVTDNINEPSGDRCAVMDLSLNGHWRVVDCDQPLRRGACRVDNDPFTWTISDAESSYPDAYDHGCPENTSLGVPRTALENTYLYRFASDRSSAGGGMDPASADPQMREIWLDFNSRHIASCWVSGGPDAQCPYASDPHQLQKRAVLVAAIAGIVICIITALTLFVKCNTNRRNSRRSKRVIQGWEYEGVPS
ncbi:lectin C-type domain protein [Aspergillus steynii IBT 23096]|uniref:Maintenance of telomere capping protein 6 n=1 Tax=Aspergillus steynii IBT 23096 TaxID=1392250 RepID=A0A2I2G4F7_9EURO|nr:lectin C-type domain protein [Aspergillus steynii IBT 23096]PLB47761.1 lectin C-type domain protein [Aspergillus steynii IBT 23096]